MSRDVNRYREPCVGRQCFKERIEERSVAVRCFDKELCFACAARFFGSQNGSAPFSIVLRQVARETEALTVEPRSHERQENRTGAGERYDANAQFMRPCGNLRTGIGNAGAAGFGKNGRIGAVKHRLEPFADQFGGWIMTNFNNVKFSNGFGMTHGFKRCTGRTGRFNEKVINAAGRFNGRRRKRIQRRCFADGARQKIELTRHHGVLRKRGKRAG